LHFRVLHCRTWKISFIWVVSGSAVGPNMETAGFRRLSRM
jgi:hypothetical protein